MCGSLIYDIGDQSQTLCHPASSNRSSGELDESLDQGIQWHVLLPDLRLVGVCNYPQQVQSVLHSFCDVTAIATLVALRLQYGHKLGVTGILTSSVVADDATANDPVVGELDDWTSCDSHKMPDY